VSPVVPPTVVTGLDDAERRLREAGVPDPRRDAAALMAQVLGTDRGGVAARKPDPLAPEPAARFAALVAARALRRPLQHLAGSAEFAGLALAVSADVLIPRPETEDLVCAVLDASLPEAARIADLGTGSGCIAIALAVRRPRFAITAVDASPRALVVAEANAKRHGVSARVAFVKADFAALPDSWDGTFDAIVSNPPYVSEAEWRELEPEVRDHEPKEALVPGPTGHEAYAVIVRTARAALRPGGLLALELGWKSEGAVRALAEEQGFHDCVVRPDLQGIPRVMTAWC
jgi:release factor glutamine methyltransferase